MADVGVVNRPIDGVVAVVVASDLGHREEPDNSSGGINLNIANTDVFTLFCETQPVLYGRAFQDFVG